MKEVYTTIKGMYRDILKDPGGGVIWDSGWQSNVIVQRCRILLAAFMKNDENPMGIQCLKLGQGDPGWDSLDEPPKPEETVNLLVDPQPVEFEIGESNLAYLDENDDTSEEPTNALQITVTLGVNQPPPPDDDLTYYPLREFGLFGKYGNEDESEDYMIDCIRHPVICKDKSATLVRVVKLFF